MISRLNAQREALETNQRLHSLHKVLTARAAWLRSAESFTTIDLKNFWNEIVIFRQRLGDFRTTYSTYYAARWPEEAAVLNSTIVSLAAIRDALLTVRNVYRAADLRYTDENVSLTDRTSLAVVIEGELEA